jgi:hypothetical protein
MEVPDESLPVQHEGFGSFDEILTPLRFIVVHLCHKLSCRLSFSLLLLLLLRFLPIQQALIIIMSMPVFF